MVNERGDLVAVKRHPEFRLFMCMNPPYTSAAKKGLPWEIRQRVTEIYVDEVDQENDMLAIIDKKAGNVVREKENIRKILDFYLNIRGIPCKN